MSDTEFGLTGCVTDRAGAPIRDIAADVTSLDSESPVPAVPFLYPEPGRYLHPTLFDGRFRVSVEAEGYAPATRDITIRGGRPAILDFVLDAAGDPGEDIQDDQQGAPAATADPIETGTGQEPQDGQQTPPAPTAASDDAQDGVPSATPDTGAGGLGAAGVALGAGLALLASLSAGGYLVRRRAGKR